jgi:hypothetical protein
LLMLIAAPRIDGKAFEMAAFPFFSPGDEFIDAATISPPPSRSIVASRTTLTTPHGYGPAPLRLRSSTRPSSFA